MMYALFGTQTMRNTFLGLVYHEIPEKFCSALRRDRAMWTEHLRLHDTKSEWKKTILY